jgi:hypothetical protein
MPGTVVRGEVPAGSLYGGCPPHVVGDRFSAVGADAALTPESST